MFRTLLQVLKSNGSRLAADGLIGGGLHWASIHFSWTKVLIKSRNKTKIFWSKIALKAHLQWWSLYAKMLAILCYLLTWLSHLWRRETNRNDPICVVPPKVAKASTVTCHCRWHYHPDLRQCKNGLNIHLQWRCFCQNVCDSDRLSAWLVHLGWRDTDSIISIYVMLP